MSFILWLPMLIALLLLSVTLNLSSVVGQVGSSGGSDEGTEARSLYDFSATDINGIEVSLDLYSSAKAILIVNVASDCGYTYVNYEELVSLYDRLKDRGLEILAFPSNQFGSQEPGSDQEIQAFATSFGASFPLFSKINVRGPDAHDVFKFLKAHTDGSEISWNFHKFLVINGYPVSRYASKIPPRKIESDIMMFLNQPDPRLEDQGSADEDTIHRDNADDAMLHEL